MKLGITSIQRNRAPWIREWVAFHYLVGFRKFCIYLHECSDHTEKILNKLKKKFDIKTINIPRDWYPPQIMAYEDSCKNYLLGIDWMAFIDADEFLFPTTAKTMQESLKEYEDKNISALGIYWSCFGSSGHIDEPDGLIIENYKYKAKDGYSNNRHIKSIVRGGQNNVVKARDPHFFKTPSLTCDENFRVIRSGWTDYQPTYNKFCINHYATQSRSFFENFKSKYQTPDGGFTPGESFWNEHDTNDVFDTTMERFVEPLKKLLESIE